MLQLLTFIPLPYLIFGAPTVIALLVISAVKGIRHIENKRATNERLQAKVWELEMRISWHKQNRTQQEAVRREVVYVEMPRQSAVSNSDRVMTTTSTGDAAALVRIDTKNDDVKDLQEELYREEEDRREHQLEIVIVEEEQSEGPFVFSPPKMTLMEVAKEPDAIFLKQAGITATPVNIQQEEYDNIVLFPSKPAIHEEFFQNFEQAEFEFDLPESDLKRGDGLYWGHYEILDLYDSSMATCLNLTSDSKQVLQHDLLGSLEKRNIFTALVQIRNKSSYVLGIYPGQHNLSSLFLEDEEMVS